MAVSKGWCKESKLCVPTIFIKLVFLENNLSKNSSLIVYIGEIVADHCSKIGATYCSSLYTHSFKTLPGK